MLSGLKTAGKKGWTWDPNTHKLLIRAKIPQTQAGCAPGSIQEVPSARTPPSSTRPLGT